MQRPDADAVSGELALGVCLFASRYPLQGSIRSSRIRPPAADREIALAAEIEALANIPVHNLAGQTNLKELLALCREARLVIGPDSGTLHMATTQETPVIGLYAHSNPQRTGPYRDLHRVADAYTPALGDIALDAKKHRWGYRLKGPKLMAQITEQEVIELVDQALAEAR